MKKIIALLLCAMSLSLFAACEPEQKPEETTAAEQTSTEEPATEAPTQAATEASTTEAPTEALTTEPSTEAPTEPVTTEVPTDAPTEPVTAEVPTETPTEPVTAEVPTEPTTTEAPTEEATDEPATDSGFNQIVLDNDKAKIEITKLGYDDELGFVITVALENRSSDTTYIYSIDSAAVNGVSCSALLFAEIEPGKKAIEQIMFLQTETEIAEIGEFTDIELTFAIYNSDDIFADPVSSITTHVYPLGEDKATTYVRVPSAADKVLMDNDKFTVTLINTVKNEEGLTLALFIVNKSEDDYVLSVENASVNGFMSDPYWACYVEGGKCAFGEVIWFTEYLIEDANISNVNNITDIEFTLTLSDGNDLFAEPVVSEDVKLKP